MIDGHKLHGNLNAASQDAMVSGASMMKGGLVLAMSMPSSMKIKYLGVELLYGEPTLLRECTTRSVSFYDCSFTLALRDYKDKRSIQNSGYTTSVTEQLRFIKRTEYSYYFWIGKDGLWHSKATEEQIAKDQALWKKLEEKWAYEEKARQEERERTNQYIEGLR